MTLKSVVAILLVTFTSFQNLTDIGHAQTQDASNQDRAGLFALPVILRFEGVGAIYGGVAGYRKLPLTGGTAIFGGVAGDVKGFGLGVTKVPLISDTLSFSAGIAGIADAHLETKYRRGVEGGSIYHQQLAAQAGALITDLKVSDRINISAGLIKSAVKLKSYKTEGGSEIKLPGANLGDIETLNLFGSVQYEKKEDVQDLSPGYKVGINLLTASGRVGQSDSLTTNISLSGSVPILQSISLAGRILTSDASIIRRESKYESKEGVAKALHADCESLAEQGEQDDCVELRNDLEDYISANNKNGTATPLGGSNSVRGYSEGRFRAAHTAVFSLESRWRIARTFSIPFFSREKNGLELAPFYDAGWASDQKSELLKNQRNSLGLGVRAIIREIPIRLDVARGRTVVWLLTSGYAW